jgi:16S rRNA (guanine527-N7)-methyltransferase
VVALLDPAAQVTMVESIAKKCAFLNAVAEETGLDDRVQIRNQRIESMPRQKFDVITARALAALDQLFEWGLPYAGSGTKWLLPKGVRASEELIAADRRFSFDHLLVPSQTDAGARIVVASGVKRR